MAIQTTQQALKTLLHDERYLDVFLKAGYSKPDRQRFIHRLDRDLLTLDKIEEILQKCGFTVAVEKQWKLPDTH